MRILIVSGIVITVLVYPALFMQLEAARQSSSSLSTTPLPSNSRAQKSPWSFIAGSRSHHYQAGANSAPPARELWEGHDALRIRDDATVIARCGIQSTIAIEHLFVRGYGLSNESSGASSDRPDIVLGPVPALHEATRMLDRIQSSLLAEADRDQLLDCVQNPGGPAQCIVVSPLDSWRRLYLDEHSTSPANSFASAPAAMSDNSLLYNALLAPTDVAGIPVHTESLISGSGGPFLGPHASDSSDDEDIYDPEFLVVTFAFKVDAGECQSTARHAKWLDLVKEAAGPDAAIHPTATLPDLFALEYNPSGTRSRISRFSALIYLTYVVVFIYFSGPLRRIDTLHSRFGMAFTGIVEIIISTLCSISVCEIVGFRLNMLPPEILPILIVFVGAENMFTVIEDVVTTKITLPVKERIAIGLSKSGTSNTIKVVSYNALLGTIAVFSTGAIFQFCVFAIVVLVVHWIHINTMFIAVLAIDLHRLELSDHLNQNTLMKSAETSNGVAAPKSSSLSAPRANSSRASVARFRVTLSMNASLFLMLAVAFALYYTTTGTKLDPIEPSPVATHSRPPKTAGVQTNAPNRDPAAQIWAVFNPAGDTFLHVKVEPPVFITFSPQSAPTTRERLTGRRYRRYLRQRLFGPIIRLCKTTIIPSFVTNFVLWLVLRYLMQDADLADAQSHRADGEGVALLDRGGESATQRVPSLTSGIDPTKGDRVLYRQLDRACAHDIALVASSSDGSIIAAISTENELAVWFEREGRRCTIDCAPFLRHESVQPARNHLSNGVTAPIRKNHPTHLVLDSRGAWCAVATDGGMIAILSLARSNVSLKRRTIVSPIVQTSSSVPSIRSILFALDSPSPITTPFGGSGSIVPSTRSIGPLSLIITSRDGNQFVWSFFTSPIPTPISHVPTWDLTSSSALDFISPRRVQPRALSGETAYPLLCTKVVRLQGQASPVSASLSALNTVIISDDRTCETICIVDDLQDLQVEAARITELPVSVCRTCGLTQSPIIRLGISTPTEVHVYHVVSNEPSTCNCAPTSAIGAPLTSNRSRRASHAITSTSSSKGKRRTSNTSTSSQDGSSSPTAGYPVSGHGVLARRDKTRDSDPDLSGFLLPPTSSDLPPLEYPTPSQRIFKMTVIPCERGLFELSGEMVIGVRKRTSANSSPRTVDAYVASLRGPSGASARRVSPYDSWEVWVLDSSNVLRASCIADLPRAPRTLSSIDENGFNTGLFFKPPSSPSSPSEFTPTSPAGFPFPPPPVRVYPRIPFTRPSALALTASGDEAIVGFGNTALSISLPRRPYVTKTQPSTPRASFESIHGPNSSFGYGTGVNGAYHSL
ncbi:hypothetical protein DL93DRAFT_2072252 [Clavulina sp. PMI_390]|nr:hypothetical protein DL93DRAFT_2072252 [Clavulina sp. PMI_390]